MTRVFYALLAVLLLSTPLAAVQPDEILADPDLEARAREISTQLRCLVCRNENIDDSNADLARDLRILVRERLTAGDTDDQVIAFMVSRYGEFVLLKPTFGGGNIVLWLTAPVLLAAGFGITFLFIRRRGAAPAPQSGLSADEQARLDALLKE